MRPTYTKHPFTGAVEEITDAGAAELIQSTDPSLETTIRFGQYVERLSQLYPYERMWPLLLNRAALGAAHTRLLFCAQLPEYVSNAVSVFDFLPFEATYRAALDVLDVGLPLLGEELAAFLVLDSTLVFENDKLLPELAGRGFYAPSAWHLLPLANSFLTEAVAVTASRMETVASGLNPAGTRSAQRATVCYTLASSGWLQSAPELRDTVDGILHT